MRYRKTEVAPQYDGRPSKQKVVGIPFGEPPDCQSLKPYLKSIIFAAHKLPAEVVPPARVWRSLRVQLENEGILSRPVKGRLEIHTRFPMFKN